MKYQFTVSFHNQTIICDTEDDDLKEALEADEIDPSDIDAVSEWIQDGLNGDHTFHDFLNDPEVESVWQGKKVEEAK